MKYYRLDHAEYVRLIRRVASVTDTIESPNIIDMLIELAQVKFDYNNLYFEVSESLMQRIAVLNMAEMSLLQLIDSAGDIDYTGLGDNSASVLTSIIHNINEYGCESV